MPPFKDSEPAIPTPGACPEEAFLTLFLRSTNVKERPGGVTCRLQGPGKEQSQLRSPQVHLLVGQTDKNPTGCEGVINTGKKNEVESGDGVSGVLF